MPHTELLTLASVKRSQGDRLESIDGLINKLRKEDDSEILFARIPAYGVIIILGGIGMMVSGYLLLTKCWFCWILCIVGVIITIEGYLELLSRTELHIDLRSKKYKYTDGFRRNPKTVAGSLDDLEAVVLSSREEQQSEDSVQVWLVSLSFKGMDNPIAISKLYYKVKAFEKMEHFSKKLNVPAVVDSSCQEQINR